MGEGQGTDPKPVVTRQERGLAGGIAAAIGWLASSLGVFGALLYGCGYLISVAQLHLLGLGRLMSYGHDYYVQQGGSFFADLGSTVAIATEPFLLILITLVVMAFGISLIWRKAGLAQRSWADRFSGLCDRARHVWPRVAYAALLLLLLSRYGDPMAFGLPLTLSNALFAAPPSTAPAELMAMHRLLLTGDRSGLAAMFEGRLLTYVAVCLLLLACHYVTQGWPWRRLALAPFVLLFALYSLFLPMLYGVLRLQVEFPVVTVWPGEDVASKQGQQGFLLNLSDGRAVLYIAAEHKVALRRQEAIDRLDVMGPAPILKATAAP